jgi:hypothetical protein
MFRFATWAALALAGLASCQDSSTSSSRPPPGGWANRAPTTVERVVNRADSQLLEVRQGRLKTWVRVPQVGAEAGDYILLGQGTPRRDVEIPEAGKRVAVLVEIEHARVVDRATAERTVVSSAPEGALKVGEVYGRLDELAGNEVVVYGVAVKVAGAVGWYWVHLQDGTGDPSSGTHDLTVQTTVAVAEGQRVAFRGVLRRDVDLGFGYQYDALVEDATFVE